MRIHLNPNQPNIMYNGQNADKKEVLSASISDAKIDVVLTKPEKNKSASSAAIAAVAAVFCFLMLSRGVQKNNSKFLNKIKTMLESRVAHYSLKESEKIKSLYEFFIRRVNSFIKKSESINNITSLKDILFMKFMYKTEPTKKLHESISRYFEKVSQKTVFKSYKKTEKQFDRMYKIFDELDEQLLKQPLDEKVIFDNKECTKKQLLEEARENRELAKMAVGAFINEATIKARYDHINNATSSLYSKFWDASFKDFWSRDNKFKRKEMWQTFIAAEQIKTEKSALAGNIEYIRNAVTYSPVDQTVKIQEYIKAIDSLIPPHDKEGISIIKKLEYFSKNPDAFQNNEELFFKELEKLSQHKIPVNIDSKMSQALHEYKDMNVQSIYKQINDNSPGFLEKMLDRYYRIAPYELEDSGALLSLKKAVNSFDRSVDLESVEFFDKLRDLKLGSAPTDVLTILLSFITLSYGLGHAKDKDKRASIMLNSGIPIAGGIAMAMYTAAKLVSGGKSLAVGFLSGIILNRLGKIADNVRKNYNAEKLQKESA